MEHSEVASRLNEAYEYLRSVGKIHTQKDLANLMHSSTSTVSKALSGEPKSLTEKFVLRFNHTFGDIFEINWLLGKDGSTRMLNDKADLKIIPVYYNQEGYFHANGEEMTGDYRYKKLCDTTYVKWKYFSNQILSIQRKYGFNLKYGLIRELWLDYEDSYQQGENNNWKPSDDLLFNYGIDIIPEDLPKSEDREEESGTNEGDLIPLLPVEAMAGTLQGLSEGVELANCRKIKSPVKGADWAIQISGDSMEPDYRNGSYLYIRKMRGAFIPWGHTMVVDTYDGVVVKNVFPVEGNDDYIEARSINPKYPPFRIEATSILGFYRVLGGSFINSTI